MHLKQLGNTSVCMVVTRSSNQGSKRSFIKLDRECREEKYRLLELIEVFQKAIDELNPNRNILIKEYSALAEQVKRTKRTVIDLDQYNGIVQTD